VLIIYPLPPGCYVWAAVCISLNKIFLDVSFIIDCNMCLYEHQSTYCPNKPLRGFLYFADLYKKYIRNVDLSGSRQIKAPMPHYVVFYNGTERKEQEQKSEVIAMSIYEYNEEYVRKVLFEDGMEKGYNQGIVDGEI